MTIYLDTNYSGNYNCDGVDDHIEINKALKNHNQETVHLNGPNTYWINDTILIGSNTTLEGDSDAKIKLINNAHWPQFKGLVMPIGGSADNIIVQGFEIDGNGANQSEPTGKRYYTMLFFDNCTNVTVRNMYLHDNKCDGVCVYEPSYVEGRGNINVYNNTIYRCCHDGVQLMKVCKAHVYNNIITPRTNVGIRAGASNHVSIHNNTISPGVPTAGSGILIQKPRAIPAMNDIEIYNNNINGSNLCGIHLIGYNAYTKDQAKDVHIHHNIITGVGQSKGSTWNVAGIAIQGFHNTLIENNVIDGNYADGIATNTWLTGAPGSGYVTIVRNNIITNTKRHLNSPSGTGNGIANRLSSTHSFIIKYNDVWNNINENYYNVSPGSNDIQKNPLFINSANNDYHLQSSSPCIDAGDPSSNYSNEPQPNGNRINIGRYGNTSEATRSPGSTPTPSPTPIKKYQLSVYSNPPNAIITEI